MLAKAIRALTTGTVEEKDGTRHQGPFSIDRKMNIKLSHTLVKGTQLRYLVLSDKDLERILGCCNGAGS
ncbi:hypothetical protein NEDG_00746 [Nematocida displodere]|uniref:LSM domain-containing protein n=1 Tax=Nematocida displodere TaxID=1805483 RepID=A0A177ECD0_9MICR|nr:hypothetical protein NEDG_00746 [Nematocida displodere]